jgi:hypothetical protein
VTGLPETTSERLVIMTWLTNDEEPASNFDHLVVLESFGKIEVPPEKRFNCAWHFLFSLQITPRDLRSYNGNM